MRIITVSLTHSMGNDQLKWETSTKYDAGFDALFFDGKYKLTFDYYPEQSGWP